MARSRTPAGRGCSSASSTNRSSRTTRSPSSQATRWCFYTDGLVELGEAGDGFGWLRDALRGCAGGSAAAIADRVRRDAAPRAERLDDDQAVLVLCTVRADGDQGSITLRGSGLSSGGAWL